MPASVLVDRIKNFKELHVTMSILPNVLIQVSYLKNVRNNIQKYEKLKKIIDGEHSYHLYKSKHNMQYTFLTNRLHPSTNPELMIHEVRKLGYKHPKVISNLKFKFNSPLPYSWDPLKIMKMLTKFLL